MCALLQGLLSRVPGGRHAFYEKSIDYNESSIWKANKSDVRIGVVGKRSSLTIGITK